MLVKLKCARQSVGRVSISSQLGHHRKQRWVLQGVSERLRAAGIVETQGGVSAKMFTALCDQIAIMADTQVREREQMQQENRAQIEVLRRSMEAMSQRMASQREAPRAAEAMPSTLAGSL